MNISVVIPTLNEAATIAQAIDSARKMGAHEIIVADANSEDDTQAIATNLGCRVVQTEKGRGNQLAGGAAQCQGDVFLFLHADCQIDASAGKQILTQLKPPAIFGGFVQSIQDRRCVYRWIEKGNQWRIRWRGLVYGDQAMFVRREAYEQVGGYDPIPLMEDVAISDRLKRLSWPLLLPGPVIVNPRRWRARGWLRQTALNWWYFSQYRLGASPHRLARAYHRSPNQG